MKLLCVGTSILLTFADAEGFVPHNAIRRQRFASRHQDSALLAVSSRVHPTSTSIIDKQKGEGRINAVHLDDFPYTTTVTTTTTAAATSTTQSNSWIQEAAKHLKESGVCVLLPSEEEEDLQSSSKITSTDCQTTQDAALSRLFRLKESIRKERRGVDPDGREGTFRYMEVVSRDESGGRFAMPVPWKNSPTITAGIPLSDEEADAVEQFHSKLQKHVGPVIERLWNEEKKHNKNNDAHVAASGFLINQPGSTNQIWHRDGPNEGLINVFCPLVDLTPDMGPTQVWSKTHLDDNGADTSDPESLQLAPLMKRGQILLMDYRTYHRGLGNFSRDRVRTIAYAVYHKGSSSLGDMLGYGLLPTAYQSIEAKGINIQEAHELFFSVTMTSGAMEDWAHQAANHLQQHGVCVLRGDEYLPDAAQLEGVNTIAMARLVDLQKRIENRGMDPTGKEGPFQFNELSSRDEGGGRFDMPIAWSCADTTDGPLWSHTVDDTREMANFQSRLQDVMGPVFQRLWDSLPYHVSSSGFLVNGEGSSHHQWHRDGSQDGSVVLLCPLVDLTEDGGLMEVWPKSHIPQPQSSIPENSEKAAPLLKGGEMLLLDFRTLRQSMNNESKSSWTMAYAVIKKGPNCRTTPQSNGSTLEYD
eukprot:scaffold1_cov108-Cylindrotheca_fusiformis.AAC.3